MSLMLIRLRESPNQSERIHGQDAVNLIVCHTPEGSYEGTVNYILNPNANVSYHCLINKEGTEATQFVLFEKKAWHAGVVNSRSEGISVADYARHFDISQGGVKQMAAMVARRLVTRKLPCQWSTTTGFCRHADLQSDRSDPTPDIAEWKIFVAMVREQYLLLTKPWPIPIPDWFWTWARWKKGAGEFKQYGPSYAPVRPGLPVPPPGLSWAPGGKHFWAWRRLAAMG